MDRQKREVGRGSAHLDIPPDEKTMMATHSFAPLSLLLLKVFYQYAHSSALRTSCSQRPKHTIPNQSHRIGRGAKVSSNLNLISKSPWSQGREAPLEGNSEQEPDCEGSINLYDYSPFAKSQWDQFVAERRRLIVAKKQSLYQ